MANEEETRKWIEKARDDYGFSASVLPETTFYSQVCFFFQQSAEKYLKAYVVANNLDFKKIHDLIELLKICRQHDLSFEQLLDDCITLNVFYVDTRYPVHWPTIFKQEEALRAQEAAANVKEFVENKLKPIL